MNLGALPTVYSVFNYHTGLFDYYQPPVQPVLPASGYMRSPRGVTPESLAMRLPSGCTKVGSGAQARGMIAATDDNLGGLDLAGVPWWAIALAGVGVLAVRRSKRKKGRA